MANISTYLQKILSAIYGEEVRGSIHDALSAMNVESSSAMEYAKTAKDSAAASASTASIKATAILYRNNDSALPLIDLLEQKGVPYACRQREGFFFTCPLVRDVTDMLEFAFDDGNTDLFLRFYYKLDLKLKKAVVTKLLYGMKGQERL